MQLDYMIEEMLLQSPNLAVYKARGRNGILTPYDIQRLAAPGQALVSSPVPMVPNKLIFPNQGQKRQLNFC